MPVARSISRAPVRSEEFQVPVATASTASAARPLAVSARSAVAASEACCP